VKWTRPLLAAAALVCAAAAPAAACTLSATGLQFGAYDPHAAAPLHGQASIEVNCPAGVEYAVLIGPGQNGTGAPTRGMRAAGSAFVLRYEVYADATYQQVWSDGAGATVIRAGSGGGSRQALIVYGRIFPGQQPPPGLYTDVLTVTVNF
jgi:spore coat protein U-like protein